MIKWSQWSPNGLERCGQFASIKEATPYLNEFRERAAKLLPIQSYPHAVYARKDYDADGNVVEIRFYLDAFLTDELLDSVSRVCSNSLFLTLHKHP